MSRSFMWAAARSMAVVPGRSWRSMYSGMRFSWRGARGSGVELDDQALFDRDRKRDLGAVGLARERALQLVLVPVEVPRGIGGDLERLADRDEVLRLVADLDHLARLHASARDVDP